MHNEIEDGFGCSGLVPTGAERAQERAEQRQREREAAKDAEIIRLKWALQKIAVIGNEDGLLCDEYQQRLIASCGYARNALRETGNRT